MALSSARVKKTVVAIVGCVKALLPLTPALLLRGLNSIGSASLKGASLAGSAPMILASPSNFKRGRSQRWGRAASQAAATMRQAAEYPGDSATSQASTSPRLRGPPSHLCAGRLGDVPTCQSARPHHLGPWIGIGGHEGGRPGMRVTREAQTHPPRPAAAP